jgi:predicted phosphodiesterase
MKKGVSRMSNYTWTDDKKELLKTFIENSSLSYANIAKKMKTTEATIEHAIRRYGYTRTENHDMIMDGSKKLTRNDINELAGELGKRLYDGFQPIAFSEPKAVKGAGKREEISVLDISDVHVGMINHIYDEKLGRKIVTYNHEIFLQELDTLYKSIKEIHDILSPTYRLRKLVIFVLGDVVTNDRIFPEQVFEIEKCVGLQMWDSIGIFSQFFKQLLSVYEEIEIVCVVGNHGRSNPSHYNEPIQNNFEYHIYRCWQKQFENSKRVKVIVPDTGRYIHKVGPWRHLIEHGHNLRGYTPNAIQQQVKDMCVNVGNFDVFHFGHIHELAEKRVSDKVLVKQNGCWIYKDEYAWTKFKNYSIPEQHFFGCNEKRKETWAFKLDLRA